MENRVTKKCERCKQDLPLNNFSHSRNAKCMPCCAEVKAENLGKRLAKNRAKKQEQQKKRLNAIAVKKVNQQIAREKYKAKKSDEAAAIEMADRELCRRHLLPFIKRFVPNYNAGWVHIDICERLERFYQDVVDRKSPRLMLFCPPRLGKSEIASVNFPSWVMGKNPDFKFIATSYAASLATDFSRQVRDRIKDDDRYHQLFPDTKVSPSQQNVERWGTTNRGIYIAAGVDGPISGRGGYIMLIDDPIKNRADADSEVIQEAAWKWYTSTFMTRSEPGGGILIIQTRWSDMDISQRLIDMMEDDPEAERWEVISYPALAEEDEYIDTETHELLRSPSFEQLERPSIRLVRQKGDALHPARYDEKALNQRRVMMGPRDWSALYQQNPVPDEGEFFKKDWFILRTPPSYMGMKNLLSCDLAIGQKDYNHKTCIVVAAVDWDGTLHIRHIELGRFGAHEIVERVLDLHKQYDVFSVGIENGGLKLALQDQFSLRMRERRQFPSFDNDLTPILDKEVRARPFQGLMQAGVVNWPSNTPAWYTMAMRQLLRFPATGAGQDDIVDALAWMGRMYHHVSRPALPRFKQKRQKSWKSQLKAYQRESRSAMSA